MATREYQFVTGPETSTLPTSGTPSAGTDLITKEYADENYMQGGSGVADITALKAVSASNRSDKDIRFVESTGQFYAFDSGSSATNDDDLVVQPTSGSGRWLKIYHNYFDGGTGADTKRLTLPKNTLANIQALTRKEGTVWYASDVDKIYADDGTSLTEVGSGSGSGGINYISNPSAETGTTGWSTFADAASATPTDLTGGSPNSTWTRTTSSPLRGTGSFLWTKSSGASRQGEGVSYAITLDSADQGQVMQISFDYSVASGTYADNALQVWVYDVTNAVLIQPAPTNILNTSVSTRWQGAFQTATNSTSYRVGLYVPVTTDSANTLKFDNWYLGPQTKSYGPMVGDWTSYTPTGSWSTNTTYTGFWRRVGDSMEVQVKIATSGAPTSANLTVNIPTGYSVDTTKLPSTSVLQTLKESSVIISDSDSTAYTGMVRYSSTTAVSVVYEDASAQLLNVTQAAPFTFASGDYVTIAFAVPITGWSSGQLLSSDADTRIVAARFTKSGSQSSTAGGDTTVTSWAVDYDTHGGLTGSNTYTVKVPGYYKISVYGQLGAASAVAAYKINGGSTVYMGTTNYTGSGLDRVAGSDTRNLVAGDVITPVIYTSASVTISATSTIFAVERLTGPSQIAASEKVAARYTDTSGASITGAVFKYQTKTIDTHNSYSTSTGLFTCPTAGLYKITAAIGTAGLSTTQALYVGLYKNNAYLTSLAQIWGNGAAGGVYLASGSDLTQCVAGDTLEIRPSDDSSGAATTSAGWNILIIEKVN